MSVFSLWAGVSPISSYNRVIEKDNSIRYVHTRSNFEFKVKKIIDTENIYNKGVVDTYDDEYIKAIIEKMKPVQVIKGGNNVISIVFGSEKNKKIFLENSSLDMYKKENLTIKVYIIKTKDLTLPLNLVVYPFFVIGDRYVQGMITKKHLRNLILDSDYASVKSKIDLEKLQKRLKNKYKIDSKTVSIKYNAKKELFEVYKKDTNNPYSYISKDGRYILSL